MPSVKQVLVIGGAGEFGAELCSEFVKNKIQPVVFDDLRTGLSQRVTFGPLVKVKAQETPRIVLTLNEYQIQDIFHCALSHHTTQMSDLDLVKEDWESLISILRAAQQVRLSSLWIFCPAGPRLESLRQLTEAESRLTGIKMKWVESQHANSQLAKACVQDFIKP